MNKKKSRKKGTNHNDLGNITRIWVDLLIPFSVDYSKKMSASSLAKLSGTPQQSVSRHLNALVKLNLINYVKEGRNKLFYLDPVKQSSCAILNMIEHKKSLNFALSAKNIIVIIEDILRHCESILVFGSYASGSSNKESDLDLLVLGKHGKGQIKRIKQRQVTCINEHYASYAGFSKSLRTGNALAIEIMQNHLLFGDVSKIVEIFRRRAIERK